MLLFLAWCRKWVFSPRSLFLYFSYWIHFSESCLSSFYKMDLGCSEYWSKKEVTSCQDAVPARREVWSTSRSCFQNEAGLHTRCPLPNDAGLHTSQVESSTVHVLVALVKAERKHVATLENVVEFLKKRKEQSDALFTQAKEEMEEARKKLAEAE